MKDALAEQAGALEMQVIEARRLAVRAYTQPWSLTPADVSTLTGWQQTNEILFQNLRSPNVISPVGGASSAASTAMALPLSPTNPYGSVEGSPGSANG